MSGAARGQDYDFGQLDDEYRGFDPREGEGARGPLILALAIGVLLIFGAVIWNTYKQGVRQEPGALPIIFADDSPYKRVPSERGGTTAPDQDMRIYDQLDGSERDVVNETPDANLVLAGGPPIELRPDQLEDLDPVSGIPEAVLAEAQKYADLDELPDTPEDVTASVITAPLPEPEAEPVLETGPDFAFRSDGAFLVQIAALRSQEAADTAWGQAIAENPSIFRGAEKRIQRADLGAKGVFYRLRVGAFETRTTASAFCDELKKRGKTCIVATG